MSFSDEQLAKHLQNMATDAVLSGDDVKAKILSEASARILTLTHTKMGWHPATSTAFQDAYVEIVDFIVKNQGGSHGVQP